VFLQWPELLAPLHLTRFSPDGWGAYARHLDPAPHTMDKAHPQKIANKPIRLLLDSRVMDLPRSSHCIVVTFSSSKPLLFNNLKQTLPFSGNVEAQAPGIQ